MIVRTGWTAEVGGDQKRSVCLFQPLHAPRSNQEELALGIRKGEHLPRRPFVRLGVVRGIRTFMRTGLVQELGTLLTVAEFDADHDQLAALGVPARRNVADGDRLVVVALLPSQLRNLRRA